MDELPDQSNEIDLNPALAIEQIDSWVDALVKLSPNIGVALVFLIVMWFIARLVRNIINRVAVRRNRNNLGEVFGSFIRWAIVLFSVAIAVTIIFPSIKPGDLVAGLGIGSVAIGFAFKDILQNWLAGMLILVRQPFRVGDIIVAGGYEGTVDHIESRATIIRTYDGCKILIPNAELYTDAVTVLTAYPKRRNQYDFGIGYADDLEQAQAIIVETVSNIEGVLTDPAPEALPWDLAASWVTIRARWWVESNGGYFLKSKIDAIVAVKKALVEAGMDLPYETQVHLFHDQTEEFDGDRTRQREGWPAPPDADPPRPRAHVLAEREAARAGAAKKGLPTGAAGHDPGSDDD